MDRNALTALIIAVAVVVAVVAIVPLLFMPMMMGMMGGAPIGPGMPGPGAMPAFAWIVMLFPLLIVVGVVILAAWAARQLSQPAGSNRQTTRRETPLEILQRRYAAGEIGREEYERIRADLTREGAAG